MSDPRHLDTRNKEAWDRLYRRTRERVWGQTPIGFLAEMAPYVRTRLPAGARALDAATGEGRNLPVLTEWADEVHGCDASRNALDKIPEEVRREVCLKACELQAMPYADGTFDLVLLSDTFETLPDPQPVLAELARVVRAGGFLLANIPDTSDEIAGVDMDPAEEGGQWYRGRYYYRFYNRDEAVALLAEAGYEVDVERVCHWVEPAHPNFRDEEHHHTSRVFLLKRAAGVQGRGRA